jgi:hypothetical protein
MPQPMKWLGIRPAIRQTGLPDGIENFVHRSHRSTMNGVPFGTTARPARTHGRAVPVCLNFGHGKVHSVESEWKCLGTNPAGIASTYRLCSMPNF